MNKFKKVALSVLSLTFLASCNANPNTEGGGNAEEQVTGIKTLWDDSYKDVSNGFNDVKDIKEAKLFINGEYKNEVGTLKSSNDNKLEFYNKDKLRFVDKSNGYTFSLPKENLSIDYELAKYGTKFNYEDYSIRVSKETNCYTKNKSGFMIYVTEWLDRYINNQTYLSDNDLSYTKPTIYLDKSIKNGFEASIFSIKINNHQKIKYPYYNITFIKEAKKYQDFTLFLYKGKEDGYDKINEVLKSYELIRPLGTAKNYLGQIEAKENPKWNDETKKYFDKLKKQENIDWGFFNCSLCNDDAWNYETLRNELIEEKGFLESKEGADFKYEILPTYTHIGWYQERHHFPNRLAKEFAGGNGFNDKPVLQFTYQFTTNNNKVSPQSFEDNYTPMYDILRGKFDEQFKKLALDIKSYGKPVLFRLNNEMNTDWTSYSGIMTLIDPDIFVDTWRYLYNIFEENGVDNAIWIFNPIAKSCPYSNWGEDLNYFPGNDYVQMIGLTSYAMNNGSEKLESFRTHYQTLYEKNRENYINYPWIISEFACGSGGEFDGTLYHNQASQAEWVKEMFIEISNYSANEYIKKIKGAVWFSVNDYAEGKVMNALEINKDLPLTLKAFRDGFNLTKGN